VSENVPENIGDIARQQDKETVAPGEALSLAADAATPSGQPDAPNPQERDSRGRFLSGNLAAVSHALRAVTLPAELQHLREEVAAYEAGCLADEGGDAADVPIRRRSQLTYRARLHRRIIQLDDAIELRGLLDRRGKLRVTWLQQLSSLITTAKAIDTLLGLERRTKPVPGPLDYIHGRANV
jgi:hypothetical protein